MSSQEEVMAKMTLSSSSSSSLEEKQNASISNDDALKHQYINNMKLSSEYKYVYNERKQKEALDKVVNEMFYSSSNEKNCNISYYLNEIKKIMKKREETKEEFLSIIKNNNDDDKDDDDNDDDDDDGRTMTNITIIMGDETNEEKESKEDKKIVILENNNKENDDDKLSMTKDNNNSSSSSKETMMVKNMVSSEDEMTDLLSNIEQRKRFKEYTDDKERKQKEALDKVVNEMFYSSNEKTCRNISYHLNKIKKNYERKRTNQKKIIIW